jgi:hypothetical protein
MIRYEDQHGRTIAWAHQYLFADGRHIPQTPRPDPKFVFENGIRYKLDPAL